MIALWAALLVLWLLPAVASAALPQSALDTVEAAPLPGAQFPLTLRAPALSGKTVSFGEALGGHAGFVVFADYTCAMLCGPALVLLADAIERDKLPSGSYRVVVIGLDPKDSPDDAAHMRDAQIPETLRAGMVFLRPDAQTVAAAADALGFHYVYDAATDQFAHPQLVYAVGAEGGVRKMLSPFALTVGSLASALASPSPPQFYDRIRTFCYRLGLSDSPLSAAIETAVAAGTLLTLIGLIAAMRAMKPRTR